jgi:hypothetical protein
MESVILWVHVICGVAWVGASATFVVAAVALSGEPEELSLLVMKAAPRINRLCMPLAVVIPVTGIGNLFFAANERGRHLPFEFVAILTAKLALLAVMTLALWRARRAAQLLRNEPLAPNGPAIGDNMRDLITFYGLIMAAGIIALALGFWLSGT